MSHAVLADAQFSVARVLRPFAGFETVYQGQPSRIPIAFPGNLDRDAGKTGFDPNLIAGIPVPFGARLVLWIPTVLNDYPDGPQVEPYRYELVWRVRNLRDFRANRTAYHFPRQHTGEDGQFVIPAAAQGLVYEGVADTTSAGALEDYFAKHKYVRESVSYMSSLPEPPLTPAGDPAAIQQGLNASVQGSNNSVSFNKVEFDAMGDELIILAYRDEVQAVSQPEWDFGALAIDSGFSAVYGTANGSRSVIEDMGIYVFTGSNP